MNSFRLYTQVLLWAGLALLMPAIALEPVATAAADVAAVSSKA